MRFTGRIKAITFKDSRASVLLEDARIFTDAQIWEDYTDLKLVKTGKYAKGEVWMSSFKEPIFQALEELKKMGTGIEVEVGVVENKGFLNIAGIGLKVPEHDVNADLEPPEMPEEEKKGFQAQIEEMAEEASKIDDTPAPSTTVDTTASKEVLIIRQTCIKAVGSSYTMSGKATDTELFVALAKRLEKYVLSGE